MATLLLARMINRALHLILFIMILGLGISKRGTCDAINSARIKHIREWKKQIACVHESLVIEWRFLFSLYGRWLLLHL